MRLWRLSPRWVFVVLVAVLSCHGEGRAQQLTLGAVEGEAGTPLAIPLRLSSAVDIDAITVAFEWDDSVAYGLDLRPSDVVEDADQVFWRLESGYAVLMIDVDSDETGEVLGIGSDLVIATLWVESAATVGESPVRFVDDQYSLLEGDPAVRNAVVVKGAPVDQADGLVLVDGSVRSLARSFRLYTGTTDFLFFGEEIGVFLENSEPVDGFVVSLCHTEALLNLTEIQLGPAAVAADFTDALIVEGGGHLTVIMDAMEPVDGSTILPDEANLIATFRYECNGLVSCSTALEASVRFCDGVLDDGVPGESTIENSLTVGPSRFTHADRLRSEDGRVSCVGECPPPIKESCSDGVDNDGNGLTDCEDDSCLLAGFCQGRQLPGDCNQDGTLDISDALCVFGTLFLGLPSAFPCGDGKASHTSNLMLLDWQLDTQLDVSDGIGLLNFLFVGGIPHPRAMSSANGGCITIFQCPDNGFCPGECFGAPGACPQDEPSEIVVNDFIRGDVNGDGDVSLLDPIYLLNWLCVDGPAPPCMDAADTDDSGCVNFSDAQFFPFVGFCPFSDVGFCAPRSPFPDPGPDVGIDYLGCETPPLK